MRLNLSLMGLVCAFLFAGCAGVDYHKEGAYRQSTNGHTYSFKLTPKK